MLGLAEIEKYGEENHDTMKERFFFLPPDFYQTSAQKFNNHDAKP